MGMRIGVRRIGGECVGTVSVPAEGGGMITATGISRDKASALHKAALLAERIVTDPVLSAILPPGAGAALVATKQLASAAKAGLPALRSLWGSIRGKGKKRLAKALARERASEEPAEVGDVGFDAATAMGIATGPGGYIATRAAQALAKKIADRKRRKAAAKRRRKRARARARGEGRGMLDVIRNAKRTARNRPPAQNPPRSSERMPDPMPEPQYDEEPVVTYDEPPYGVPTSITPEPADAVDEHDDGYDDTYDEDDGDDA